MLLPCSGPATLVSGAMRVAQTALTAPGFPWHKLKASKESTLKLTPCLSPRDGSECGWLPPLIQPILTATYESARLRCLLSELHSTFHTGSARDGQRDVQI